MRLGSRRNWKGNIMEGENIYVWCLLRLWLDIFINGTFVRNLNYGMGGVYRRDVATISWETGQKAIEHRADATYLKFLFHLNIFLFYWRFTFSELKYLKKIPGIGMTNSTFQRYYSTIFKSDFLILISENQFFNFFKIYHVYFFYVATVWRHRGTEQTNYYNSLDTQTQRWCHFQTWAWNVFTFFRRTIGLHDHGTS